jgi:hypothetical protein
MVAAGLFGAGGTGGPIFPEWQSGALGLGLVVTLFGLATLELVVRDAGERILGRLGTVAFLLGCISWIVADAIALSGLPFVFELERNYVLLACLAQVAFGWAILRTEVLPRWLGWSGIGWSLVWAVLYLSRIVEAPLGLNLVTFLFGLLLLRRRTIQSADDAGSK